MIFLIDLYIIKRVVKNYIIIHIIQIIVHLNILIILSLMNNICIVIQNVIFNKTDGKSYYKCIFKAKTEYIKQKTFLLFLYLILLFRINI